MSRFNLFALKVNDISWKYKHKNIQIACEEVTTHSKTFNDYLRLKCMISDNICKRSLILNFCQSQTRDLHLPSGILVN